MKNREIQKLAKQYLIPHLEGYVAQGQLLVRIPANLFVCGYCFEGSSFAHDRFTICAFVQPLYVPCDHIVLSVGKRLGNIIEKPEKWWEIDMRSAAIVMSDVLSVIQAQAEPALQLFTGPKSFVEHIGKLHSSEKDPYRQESLAYAYILSGDYLQARKSLARLLPYLDGLIIGGTVWAREIRERVRVISGYVECGDPQSARTQLIEWATYTTTRLKLEKLIKINSL